MSTIDEVLAAAEVVDAVCVIDGETRIISVPTEYKELGVESDEKVTRVKFQCPKNVGDNIDLTEYNLYINYRNAGNKLNSYLVEDVTVTGDTINFSWLLSRHVTESPGTINYIVCAKKSDDTGVINEWNTKVATGIVGIGLEATEEIEEQNIDAIEQILRSIVELENKVDGGGSGLTTAQINALDGMFKVCAFIKDDISAEYTAFKTAFGITDSGGETEATLTSISVTYDGGDVAVGTAVTDLTGIVVTANYSDGSKRTVTGYTLSGTIAEGSNTITVTYEGMTTIFNVTGVAEGVTLSSISATYSGGDVAVGTAVTDLTGLVVTAHYSDGTSHTVTGYTLSGTIAEGSNTVTVTYQGKTATFTVTGVAESGGGDKPVDTTAKIAGTGYGLNSKGEIQPSAKACYTEFYSFGRTIEGSDSRKVIYYVSSNNEGGMGGVNSQQVWQDDAFVTYWTTKYDGVNENNFSGSYGPFNRVRFSLVTAYIDDDYAYFADTGEVIFAGKNTQYYGMANIDGTMAVKV